MQEVCRLLRGKRRPGVGSRSVMAFGRLPVVFAGIQRRLIEMRRGQVVAVFRRVWVFLDQSLLQSESLLIVFVTFLFLTQRILNERDPLIDESRAPSDSRAG